jgi:thiol:disulfide interchange protein DsbG
MYDEKGANLSEQLIQKDIYAPAGRELWQKMEKASWILDGKKTAPRVIYVFADPFCPYCKQFWQQARPWVESGKVQLRTLMVGVIKPESPATAAAIMTSKDPAKTWHDYEQSGGKLKLNVPSSVAPAQMQILNDNQKIMDELGANATPAIYYLNDDNMLQQVVGLPDAENLKAMMGEK